jgi:hypothetical protein
MEQKKSLDISVLQKKLDAALENLDRFVHHISSTVEYPESQG